MDNRSPSPLLLEKAALWLLAKCREFLVPLASTFAFGLYAFLFAFTNKLVNHDDASALFTKGASTAIGRWGLEIANKILPDYSLPWFYGILTLILMAAAICLILHIFSVRSKLVQALFAGAIIVFPSMTGVFSYMFMSSTYAICYLFSVIAVYLVNKDSRKGFLPAVIFQILSLSLYQAHISVAAGLLVLILIQRLLQEEDIRPIIQKGFLFVAFLIASLGTYYALTLLIQHFCGITMDGYASGSMSFSLANIPSDIVESYQTFFRYITQSYLSLIPTPASRALHYLLFLSIGIALFLRCRIQKNWHPGRILLLAAMLVILPLAMNCMHLFATNDSIHTLVAFGFSSIYVLAAVLCDGIPADTLLRRGMLNAATLALTGIILVNSFVANQSFLNLHLWYENSYAFYTSLIADIKMMPEFTEDTKLAVIGYYDAPDYFGEKFAIGNTLAGIYGFRPDVYSADRFMEYYIGFPIEFASYSEKAAIQATSQYADMAKYPYYGCMQIIDDILVVKLS